MIYMVWEVREEDDIIIDIFSQKAPYVSLVKCSTDSVLLIFY